MVTINFSKKELSQSSSVVRESQLRTGMAQKLPSIVKEAITIKIMLGITPMRIP